MVNCSDLPELMPTEQLSRHNLRSNDFEDRAFGLLEERELDQWTEFDREQRTTQSDILVSMFPTLDPSLIRTLYEEAGCHLRAIETLLFLAAAAEQRVSTGVASSVAATKPQHDVGLGSLDHFPELCDSQDLQGWQGWHVVSDRKLVHYAADTIGGTWRDRAQAAADQPAPRVVRAPAPVGEPAQRAQRREAQHKDMDSDEPLCMEAEYELRHSMGQKRAERRRDRHCKAKERVHVERVA